MAKKDLITDGRGYWISLYYSIRYDEKVKKFEKLLLHTPKVALQGFRASDGGKAVSAQRYTSFCPVTSVSPTFGGIEREVLWE